MDKPLNETFFANMVEFSRWYSVKVHCCPTHGEEGVSRVLIYGKGQVRDRPLEKSWGAKYQENIHTGEN